MHSKVHFQYGYPKRDPSPPKNQIPKPPVPKDNLVLFVGTSGIKHLQGLKGRFENTRVSDYSIIHAKLSKKELEGRIFNFKKEIEANPKITKMTFIYSGHGLRSGIPLGEQIFIYEDLLNHLLFFDKTQNWNIKEIRIVLDCCYAASISGHLHEFLSQYKMIDSIQQIRVISAAEQEGKTVGFGDIEQVQFSPFFQYFFENAKNFNVTYQVDYIGQGVHVFHYGQVEKGLYDYQSIARCQILVQLKEGIWVIDENFYN